MKTLIVLAALIAAITGTAEAQAWTQPLKWDADPRATNYRVEKSVDNGASWSEATNPASRPATPAFTYSGSETGLVLFRVLNCNASTCAVRADAGGWHNEAWKPVTFPANLVTQ